MKLGSAPGTSAGLIDLQIEVQGQLVWQSVQAGARPVGLLEVLPVARHLCDQMIRRIRQPQGGLADPIPCRRGCSACCHYLVPLGELEAIDLLEQVLSLDPPGQQAVLGRFDQAVERIRQSALPAAQPPEAPGAMEILSDWYLQLELPCPLLEDGQCILYAQRPLACREHLVASPAWTCHRPAASGAQPVEMPVSIAQTVMELTSRLTGQPAQAVFLPLALDWARRHSQLAERTWPGGKVFSTLARILSSGVQQARSL